MEESTWRKVPPSAEEATLRSSQPSARRIWKNLIVEAVVFLMNFTAYTSIERLQSTLNSEAGLGVVTLSCVYACMVLSCLYAPFFIHKVGSSKWTVVVCLLGHIVYTASNFYPSWYTLVPASMLLGAISGPLWTAQMAYLAGAARQYAKILQHDSTETDLSKFNGVFYLIFELSGISGNLISSLVLSAGREDIGKGEFCGVRDCGVIEETNWTSYVNNSRIFPNSTSLPDDNQQVIVYTLFGVYLGCNILATTIAWLFLDKDVKSLELASEQIKISQHLLRTVKVFKDFRYVLLLPILICMGLAEAIIAGEITKSYVSCVLGVQMVGYAMMCYSVTGSVSSLLSGFLRKHLRSWIIVLAAAATNTVLLIYMLLWQPSADSIVRIFCVAAGWGLIRAAWHTQLYALLGATFHSNQEAVFANTKMVQSLGSMTSFAYSAALCMDVKLYIYMAVLALGVVGYGILEWKLRKETSHETDPLDTVAKLKKGCDTSPERCKLTERETSL